MFATADRALLYHRHPTPGKIAIRPTKPLVTREDLALAYSPGVGAACEAIVADPSAIDTLTSRRNLVAVVTNGTAVLGYGDIGPHAAKPVMEGKAVLFSKFAGIDAIDLEFSQKDPMALVEAIAALEPSFGGINLEDIKAPECFLIEDELKKRMSIPVFHDDQHGTAIVVSAAILNALTLVEKRIEDISCVVLGAGAAAIACLDLLVALGLSKENVTMCDRTGVISQDRAGLTPQKLRYARAKPGTLEGAMRGADLFLGLAGKNLLPPEFLRDMAKDPIVLTLANPIPEIIPELVHKMRPDALVGTGRSDYPNQVNNVLCFPYIFRGALDVGASQITNGMKIACARALAELAREEFSDLTESYGGKGETFGKDYFVPRPFDPRLLVTLPVAVAQKAMEEGVASTPLDLEAYRISLIKRAYADMPAFSHAFCSPSTCVHIFSPKGTISSDKLSIIKELAVPKIRPLTEMPDMKIATLFEVSSDEEADIFLATHGIHSGAWLHGQRIEESAIFSLSPLFGESLPCDDVIVHEALAAITRLGFTPKTHHVSPDAGCVSLEPGKGYLVPSIGLCTYRGKIGPFLIGLGRPWQVFSKVISVKAFAERTAFASLLAFGENTL